MLKRKRTADTRDGATDVEANVAASAEPTSPSDKVEDASAPPSKVAKKSDNHFRFLELPAELRNCIYEMVLQDSSVTLRRSPKTRKTDKGKIIKLQWQDSIEVSSSLAQANKQIRGEVYHMAMVSANIQSLVIDFDFGHIITFLNRLSEVELNKMGTEDEGGPQRLFKITLKHTENLQSSERPLHRWLNRMNVPGKKGTNIDYRYTFMPGDAEGPPIYRWGWRGQIVGARDQMVWVIQQASSYHVENHAGSRAVAEATKIKSIAQHVLR